MAGNNFGLGSGTPAKTKDSGKQRVGRRIVVLLTHSAEEGEVSNFDGIACA